jgi:hypothetical protein
MPSINVIGRRKRESQWLGGISMLGYLVEQGALVARGCCATIMESRQPRSLACLTHPSPSSFNPAEASVLCHRLCVIGET